MFFMTVLICDLLLCNAKMNGWMQRRCRQAIGLSDVRPRVRLTLLTVFIQHHTKQQSRFLARYNRDHQLCGHRHHAVMKTVANTAADRRRWRYNWRHSVICCAASSTLPEHVVRSTQRRQVSFLPAEEWGALLKVISSLEKSPEQGYY